MPVEIALLLYVITGAFVALLVFACREQIRGGFMALASLTASLPRLIKGLSAKRIALRIKSEPDRMLDKTRDDLQKALIEVRRGREESTKKETRIGALLIAAQAKADAEKLEAKKVSDTDETIVSIESKVKIRQLEHDLAKQQEITEVFQKRIEDLEETVQRVYTQKLTMIARDKAVQAEVEAYVQLRGFDTTSANLVFERIEKTLAEKEANLAARLLTMRRQISPEKLRQLGREDLKQVKAGLVEGVEALDGVVVMSAEATERIEHQLKKAEEMVKVWEGRAKMAEQQNNEGLAHQARQRKAPFEHSIIELTENLAHLSACTLSIGESYSQLAEAVELIDARLAELDSDTGSDGREEERKTGA